MLDKCYANNKHIKLYWKKIAKCFYFDWQIFDILKLDKGYIHKASNKRLDGIPKLPSAC